MKPWLSSFFFNLLFLLSCGGNNADSLGKISEGSDKDSLVVFKWDLIYFGHDSIQTHVRLIVRDATHSDTLEIIDLASPVKENGYPVDPDTAIIESIVLEASGWYGGGGDAIFLVKDKDAYYIYWQQVSEESDDLPADKIGEIILPSSPEEKARYISD